MTNNSFDNLMMIGRAAAGKSEFIDFIKHLSENERLKKFHIGSFEEMDDFPWLFQAFQEEDIWEKLGRPRRLSTKTDSIYNTTDYDIYKFLTLKFNIEIKKKLRDEPDFYNTKTLFVEYARGRENCYKETINLFEPNILRNTAIFYIDNTFEESLRRNTVRSSDKDDNQTILHHKTPLSVMEYYYRTHDWYEMTDKKPSGYIETHGVKIPFVTVWNMPESHDLKVLEERYSPALETLWKLHANR